MYQAKKAKRDRVENAFPGKGPLSKGGRAAVAGWRSPGGGRAGGPERAGGRAAAAGRAEAGGGGTARVVAPVPRPSSYYISTLRKNSRFPKSDLPYNKLPLPYNKLPFASKADQG